MTLKRRYGLPTESGTLVSQFATRSAGWSSAPMTTWAKPSATWALMARIKAALRRAELVPVQALPDFEASDIT